MPHCFLKILNSTSIPGTYQVHGANQRSRLPWILHFANTAGRNSRKGNPSHGVRIHSIHRANMRHQKADRLPRLLTEECDDYDIDNKIPIKAVITRGRRGSTRSPMSHWRKRKDRQITHHCRLSTSSLVQKAQTYFATRLEWLWEWLARYWVR